MKIKSFAVSLLLTVMLVSCTNGKQEDVVDDKEPSGNAEIPGQINNDLNTINTNNIIQNLQGKWKETEYPFRQVHFVNNTVKFIEEGIADELAFVEYTISKDCPFEVNNLKNAGDDDIFLVMAEAGTCEILKVSNDTLTLSGFNVSSKSDYQIIYKKVE